MVCSKLMLKRDLLKLNIHENIIKYFNRTITAFVLYVNFIPSKNNYYK